MGISEQRTLTSRKVMAAKPLFTGKARPYVITDGNVFDAALDRIRWIFEEFDNRVIVSNSGGKDSTVVLELALIVARERGCLPLKVQWLDQECEFEATVEYQRYINSRKDEIDFDWYQIPFRLYNATNHAEPWLTVWGEGEDWVREKEPDSIKVNDLRYPNGEIVDRFKEVLSAINLRHAPCAVLTGMRCEESPGRRVMMTSRPMYKWATWCSLDDASPDPEKWYHRFHPIYDWSYRDIWKAIYDNSWRYNTHYDEQFRYGVPIKNMRVSNYHHETALTSLVSLQEIEPETWERATARLAGISTYGHIGTDSVPKSLPYMFSSWVEYMHYLIDNLCVHEKDRETFRALHRSLHRGLPDIPDEVAAKVMVPTIINNDLYGTKVNMYQVTHRHPKYAKEWRALKAAEEKQKVSA